MIVCIPVAGDEVGEGWGRAERIALATVTDGTITDWQEVAVGWDAAHDTGTEGAHHARVVRFLREHQVDVVTSGHMGKGMQNVIAKLGLKLVLGAGGDARAAVLAAAAQ